MGMWQGCILFHRMIPCLHVKRWLPAGGRLVAYGMFYRTYSTFRGRSMFLEDLYVSPEYRRHGIASDILNQIAAV